MKRLLVTLIALVFVGCGGSSFDDGPTGLQLNTNPGSNGGGTQLFPFLAQFSGGQITINGQTANILITGIDENITRGDGETVTPEEFVAQTDPSALAPRNGGLTYQVGDESRNLGLEITSLSLNGDRSLNLVANIGSGVSAQASDHIVEIESGFLVVDDSEATPGATTGELAFTVSAVDAFGNTSPLPGAQITVTNNAGVPRPAYTNAQGKAKVSNLRPGPYRATVSSIGFNPVQYSNLYVQAGVTTPVTVEMTPSHSEL